ncbi:hypothetical protein HPB47_018813, partial [Ixodes persulcatus]
LEYTVAASAAEYSRCLAGPDVNERNEICVLSTSTHSASMAGLMVEKIPDKPTACAALFTSHYCLTICYAEGLTSTLEFFQ